MSLCLQHLKKRFIKIIRNRAASCKFIVYLKTIGFRIISDFILFMWERMKSRCRLKRVLGDANSMIFHPVGNIDELPIGISFF